MSLSTKKTIGDLTLKDLSKLCKYMHKCNENCPMHLICMDCTTPESAKFINTLTKKITEGIKNVIID